MLMRKKEEKKKGSPAWMATFSDLMTLILVFFILLFAFSEIDATKFRTIANSFKGLIENQSTFYFDYPPTSPIENTSPSALHNQKNKDNDENKKEELDELLQKIKKYLKDNNLEGAVMATREKRGVVLVLQESVLFDSGKAVVKQQAKPFLSRISEMIDTLSNLVEVEGHTDSNKIIQPSQYTSNWNLAGDRAANVANYFVKEKGMASNRFKISGYADTVPIATNDTAEGRAKNRRVVIIILDDELNGQKEDN